MKKLLLIILSLLIVFSLSIFFTACNKNTADPVIEYRYDGKTGYVVDEEFGNGGIITKYINGEASDTFVIDKTSVNNFSTESPAYAYWNTTVDNKKLEFPYFVSNKATDLPVPESVGTGIYLYEDIAYGDKVHDDADPESRSDDSSQIFDAYVPESVKNGTDKNPHVILYVHGGAWMIGSKSTEGADFCKQMASEGWVALTMNYAMQDANKILAGNIVKDSSFTDMVGDVGIMISYIKGFMKNNFDVDVQSICLSGLSAGAHITTLFNYSLGIYSPIKIAFQLDIVGPTQFGDIGYRKFIDPYLKYNPDTADPNDETDPVIAALVQRLLPIFFAAFGGIDPEDLDFSTDNTDALWEFADQFSPLCYVSKDASPTILAYGKLSATTQINDQVFQIVPALWPEDVSTDLLVPTTCFTELENALEKNGVHHVGKLFEGESHLTMNNSAESREWIVNQVKAFAELYM